MIAALASRSRNSLAESAERLSIPPASSHPVGRIGSILAIVVAHVGLFWMLATNIQLLIKPDGAGDIQVRIINRTLQEQLPAIQLSPVDAVIVPAPDIEVQDAAPPTDAIASMDSSQVLAPRPDPSHPNATPALPKELAKTGSAQVVLRVLVSPDGTIADAEVAGSSGQSRIDSFAADFAKRHWRYFPAMAGSQAVQYWTTVIMRFAQV